MEDSKKDLEFNDDENFFSDSENEAPDTEEKAFELGHTVNLEEPIQISKNRTIEELCFKNGIKVRMIKHMPADTTQMKMGHMVPIIAGMTGETQSTIDNLSWEDLQECVEVVSYFLGRGKDETKSGDTTSD